MLVTRRRASGLLGLCGVLLLTVVLAERGGSSGRPTAAGPADTGLPRVPSAGPESTESEPITLAFAGDVHFEGRLREGLGRPGSTLGPMAERLRAADLAMVNLESAVTTRDRPARKELEDPGNRYWFRAPPAALDVLARSGVDVASIANNHAADFGAGGLRETVAAGAASPVALVGAGLDADSAFAAHRTTVRGTDIAVLAADASPRESADQTWAARSGSGPGIAAARQPARLLAAVREADAQDDLVVVYLHWGEEGRACPTPFQQQLAQSLADAGADVVVGTHAHVPAGAGRLDSTYVSYGLGNFFWYHGGTAQTGVLELTVEGDEVVGDTWTPGRIPREGGAPAGLTGAAAASAVAGWQGLRGCTGLEPGPGESAADEDDGVPAFTSTVSRIDEVMRARMVGRSHRPGCPVPLRDLRRIQLDYVGFDGSAHRGELVVNAGVVGEVRRAFAAMYAARFPIERMQPVDDYGGDDDASMAANNTSAYNCRRVAGSSSWSAHAYGRAVDVNPVQNPYVIGSRVLPPAGAAYVDVDRGSSEPPAPGVVRKGDVVHRAFTQAGWEWGGDYAEPDYQHFAR